MHLLPQSDAVLAELLLEQSRPGDALSDHETMFLLHQNRRHPTIGTGRESAVKEDFAGVCGLWWPAQFLPRGYDVAGRGPFLGLWEKPWEKWVCWVCWVFLDLLVPGSPLLEEVSMTSSRHLPFVCGCPSSLFLVPLASAGNALLSLSGIS